MEHPVYVIAHGNPWDGMELTGPFGDADSANDYAEEFFRDTDWWLMFVNKPAPATS